MEDFFLLIGIAITVFSGLAILKLKSSKDSEKQDTDYEEEFIYNSDIPKEMKFTEEEIEYIHEFEDKAPKKTESKELGSKEECYKSVELDEKEDDYKEAVIMLYNEGLASSQIAKKLNIGKREVEIILKIRGQLK